MELVLERKHGFIKGLSILILLLLLIVFLNGIAAAQTTRRVNFTVGKSDVKFSDSARLGESDTYVIKLKKGQSCQVDVEWLGEDVSDTGQGLSGFTIVYPNKKKDQDPQDGYLQATMDGDHKIIVSPRFKKTNYRYRIIFTRY